MEVSPTRNTFALLAHHNSFKNMCDLNNSFTDLLSGQEHQAGYVFIL